MTRHRKTSDYQSDYQGDYQGDYRGSDDVLDLDPSFLARLDRVIKNLLFSLIALTALTFGTVEYWAVALFSLIVILLFLIWGIKSFFVRKFRLIFPLPLLPLLIPLGYGLFQAIPRVDSLGRHWTLSMDPEVTWQVVEVMAILLVATFMMGNLIGSRHRLLGLRNFLIAFGLIYSVFSLINHFSWNGRYFWIFQPSLTPSHPFGSFVNHNHFAGYVEMLAPIPLALVVTRTVRGEMGLINGFATAMMGIATIVSLSRGGMLSMLSGLMLVVLLGLRPTTMGLPAGDTLRRFPLMLSRFLAALVIIVTISIGVIWVGADGVIERLGVDSSLVSEEDSSNSSAAGAALYQSRGFIWSDTVRMIRANWLFGVGLGAYQTAYPIYSQRDRFHLVGQAHNDYLQVLADGGIICAIAVFAFLVLLVRYARRAINHPDPVLASLAIGCTGGVFAMLVHSLFDFNLQLISNSLLFLTLSMVIWRIGYSSMNRGVSNGLISSARIVEEDRLTLLDMEVWS
jgi:O-antigen ligase